MQPACGIHIISRSASIQRAMLEHTSDDLSVLLHGHVLLASADVPAAGNAGTQTAHALLLWDARERTCKKIHRIMDSPPIIGGRMLVFGSRWNTTFFMFSFTVASMQFHSDEPGNRYVDGSAISITIARNIMPSLSSTLHAAVPLCASPLC